jgi:hypothetical protein
LDESRHLEGQSQGKATAMLSGEINTYFVCHGGMQVPDMEIYSNKLRIFVATIFANIQTQYISNFSLNSKDALYQEMELRK